MITGFNMDYKIEGAYASTTAANIDLDIEYKGNDYKVWVHFDSKIQDIEVYSLRDDVNVDDETFNAIHTIALDYLYTPDVNNKYRTKLSELLENIVYEG